LHSPPNHFVHKNKYQTQEELQLILNTHNIHLCTSLYESWGHYLYEGLSTGNEIICSDIPAFTENLDPDLVQFVPTKINLDYTYSFDKQNQNGGFPIRQSFHIEQQHLKDIIDNFEPIGKNEERRKLFKNIIDKNIGKLIEFFKNL
jgi:glycosyltransferase involved in cell wall biosynthesis